MAVDILVFEPSHYAAARALWEATAGVGLSEADEAEEILRFLDRNPGLSLVAAEDGRILGTILVGHDGRRGLIHHLAVAGPARRQGLGQRLVREGLAGLARVGVRKCHLLVFTANTGGLAFWRAIGAERRDTLEIFSLPTG